MNVKSPTRSSIVLASLIALLCGVALGITPPLLAHTSNSIGNSAHIILSGGWPWAALAFSFGFARRSRTESMALATMSLLTAVAAYYSTKATYGGIDVSALGDPSGRVISDPFDYGSLVAWGSAAFLFGPLLGFAGNLAREKGVRGLPFRSLIPVTAFVEMTVRIRVEAPLEAPVMGATWGVVRGVAVASLIALVAHTSIRTWRSRQSAGTR
ncbi:MULTISPECIES: DUF6518 family protein [unclassified Streptomyces]|uniref:DUF6518 family protein n=1 Tax=unclassified Streptomyces TaxID=2593676 RepID=UPI00344D4172